jgi:hypothetical protein
MLVRHCFLVLAALFLASPTASAAEAKPRVYVVLWFDTEDYLLPASDDAALRLANFLTNEKVRATFKVVGEKARGDAILRAMLKRQNTVGFQNGAVNAFLYWRVTAACGELGRVRLIVAADPLSQQSSELQADAPACDVCGSITVRSGMCYKCLNCGNSMGCS